MAFVSSTVGLKSAFLSAGLPTTATCRCRNRTTSAPTMAFKDIAVSGAKILLVAGAVTLGAITTFPSDSNASLFNFRGERPSNVGLRYERYLDNCPATPNCVSSMANVVSFKRYSRQ